GLSGDRLILSTDTFTKLSLLAEGRFARVRAIQSSLIQSSLIKERSAMPVLRVVACVLLCLQFAAAQNQSTPQSTTEQPPAAQQPAAPADQSSAKPDSA